MAESPLTQLSDALVAAVERASRSVVTVYARPRYPASGIAWTDGVVVTADHAVEQDEEIGVGLPDGSRRPATLAGRDAASGIAVLRVEGGGLSPASWREAVAPIGTLALAVGRPGDGGPMATSGIVSGHAAFPGRGRDVQATVLRTDAAFLPGFSGGALADATGEVLGMCTSWGGRGMPVALPAALVGEVVAALLARGRIARGYLGIGSQPVMLTPGLASKVPAGQASGLLIVAVEPASPAERAGLFVGDILTAIDGQAVADTADLQAALGPDSVGRALALRLLRGGEPHDTAVTPAEREG